MLRATELTPNLNRIQNDAGVYLALAGLHEKAELCFERAIKIKKDDSAYFYNLGLVENNLRKYKEASKKFEEAIRLDPMNIKALIALAKSQDLLGQTAEALINFKKADNLKPNDIYNIMNLAVIHLQKGRKSIALTLMKRAEALSRNKFGERDSRTLDIFGRIKWLEKQIP